MDELVSWYRQQLDDDEKTAKEAGGDSGDLSIFEISNLTDRDGTGLPDAEAAHIALHDPAAVLADVEAKRAAIAWYEGVANDSAVGPGEHGTAAIMIELLARAYRHRPGWKKEWEA